MKRINIIKNNIITNSARLSSEAECLQFLSDNSRFFGRVEQYMLDLTNNPLPQELKDIALSSREVILVAAIDDQEAVIALEYLIPADFTYEIIDAQAEVDSEEALVFLKTTDYRVLRHLGQKALNISTTLTEQEYLDLETQRQEARTKVL
jgi:hypothetical protein